MLLPTEGSSYMHKRDLETYYPSMLYHVYPCNPEILAHLSFKVTDVRVPAPHVPIVLPVVSSWSLSSTLGGRLMCRDRDSMLWWTPDILGYRRGELLSERGWPEKQLGESMLSTGAGLGVRRLGTREPTRSCSLEYGGIFGGRSSIVTHESRLLEFILSRCARLEGCTRDLASILLH